MKKIVILILVGLIGIIGLIFYKKSLTSQTPTEPIQADLPINTIPVEERPFITLTPDTSGRNVSLLISDAPDNGQLEYEMVYNASDKQEGVFGRINLEDELQPVVKDLLLGSKSGGGKVTYHEGITAGSLTVTYSEIRLKEQFNFLRFDPLDPVVSASDLRFSAVLPKTSFKKDAVVIVMKTFGLPAPVQGKLAAGPYAFLTPAPVKGSVQIEMKLPAGDFTNAAIYVWTGSQWAEQKTTQKDEDTLQTTVTSGNVFVIAEQN